MNSLTLKENTTMKKIYRYSAIYALALSFALNTSSCSDFLQVEPTGSLTEEQVFEKIDNVEKQIKVEFDDGKIAWYMYSELEQLDLAYAITIHKAQRK